MKITYELSKVLNGVYILPSIHMMSIARGYIITLTLLRYRVSIYIYPRGISYE